MVEILKKKDRGAMMYFYYDIILGLQYYFY